MSVVGSMDQAYFVGRKEIVDWINDTLKLNIGKVEQTASGAVACQLLDAIYPGKVPLHKVNWDAKQEYEFINNYKILQSAFNKLKIDKNIEVEKLIRAKYQDNLEFMQWFKRYYELNRPAADYDPVAQRSAKGGPGAAVGGRTGSDVLNGAPKNTPIKARAPVSVGKKAPRARSVDDKENANHKAEAAPVKQASRTEAARKTMPADDGLQEKLDTLSQENTQLLTTVEGLEKERDFYFEKLTLVEELLQERQSEGAQGEAATLIDKILKILYATGAGEQAAEDEVAEA